MGAAAGGTSACVGLVAACALLLVGGGCHSLPPQGPPRVLILGDSISIGYTGHVRDLLGPDVFVVRPTREGGGAENCAGTSHGVAHIDRWLRISGGDFDVIHFNFGLHDLKRVDPESGANSNDPNSPRQAEIQKYSEQLRFITAKIAETGACAIFATTTPVPGGGVRPHRDPADVVLYNDAARQVMLENGVSVNDLYALALPRLEELQRPVNVHFTSEGSVELAAQVAASIRALNVRIGGGP